MNGLYRGYLWAYFGGIVVGAMIAARDDWWFLLPCAAVGVIASFRAVD